MGATRGSERLLFDCPVQMFSRSSFATEDTEITELAATSMNQFAGTQTRAFVCLLDPAG